MFAQGRPKVKWSWWIIADATLIIFKTAAIEKGNRIDDNVYLCSFPACTMFFCNDDGVQTTNDDLFCMQIYILHCFLLENLLTNFDGPKTILSGISLQLPLFWTWVMKIEQSRFNVHTYTKSYLECLNKPL